MAGSIFGGINASRAAKKRKKNIEKRMEDNQAWFDRRYNEDATQRADAQRLLTMTRDAIKDRNRNLAGRQAVMGGTEAAVAGEKERNNKLYGDTVSRINADAEGRKERIENRYLTRKDGLNNALENVEQQKAQAITKAAEGVAKTGASMGVGLEKYGGLDWWDKDSKTRSGDDEEKEKKEKEDEY